MPLGRKVGLGPSDIVLDGDPVLPSQKRGQAPSFGTCLLWPNGWMDQDATWYRSRPWPRPHCARCRPSSSPPKGALQFLAYIYCGQTAGWIKMPLRAKAELGPGHIVLHGDPAQPPKGHSPPIFGRCLLWPNGRPSQLLLSTCLVLPRAGCT